MVSILSSDSDLEENGLFLLLIIYQDIGAVRNYLERRVYSSVYAYLNLLVRNDLCTEWSRICGNASILNYLYKPTLFLRIFL